MIDITELARYDALHMPSDPQDPTFKWLWDDLNLLKKHEHIRSQSVVAHALINAGRN